MSSRMFCEASRREETGAFSGGSLDTGDAGRGEVMSTSSQSSCEASGEEPCANCSVLSRISWMGVRLIPLP